MSRVLMIAGVLAGAVMAQGDALSDSTYVEASAPAHEVCGKGLFLQEIDLSETSVGFVPASFERNLIHQPLLRVLEEYFGRPVTLVTKSKIDSIRGCKGLLVQVRLDSYKRKTDVVLGYAQVQVTVSFHPGLNSAPPDFEMQIGARGRRVLGETAPSVYVRGAVERVAGQLREKLRAISGAYGRKAMECRQGVYVARMTLDKAMIGFVPREFENLRINSLVLNAIGQPGEPLPLLISGADADGRTDCRSAIVIRPSLKSYRVEQIANRRKVVAEIEVPCYAGTASSRPELVLTISDFAVMRFESYTFDGLDQVFQRLAARLRSEVRKAEFRDLIRYR